MSTADEKKTSAASVKAAFGAKNRSKLIDAYFDEQIDADITPAQASAHVYRLLLWIDQTTGLAHCYESDKSQPGKRWYARSLAFHDWVSSALETPPGKLAEKVDWLFLHAAKDLAAEVVRRGARVTATAKRQREPYEGRGFPSPGEDPELVALIKDVLERYVSVEPPPEVWGRLVQRVRQYLALENKRKNLVGEGFEDVLAEVVRRTCRQPALEVHTRRALHDLPGFNQGRQGDKPHKVDVAVIRPSKRMLVTAKWSVRADRENQFVTDFAQYNSAESYGKPFEYVFVTNEFDPARLMRACEKLVSNAPMFAYVVHISTDAIRATYGKAAEDQEGDDDSMRRVLRFIDEGRLISLERWLTTLTSPS